MEDQTLIMIKIKIWWISLSGAYTGFKWGGDARFISEQKNPYLGTKRHAAGELFLQ